MRPAPRVRKTRAKTLVADLHARAVEPVVERDRGSGWPLTKYQDDPVGFVREFIGEEPMPHQIPILESLRDELKTAVASGQKTGKTKLLVWIALWVYCCFDHARVVLSANTKPQVRNVLWHELNKTRRASRNRIEGRWSDNPETGFRADDGREIYGITAKDIESMAGVSGGVLVFLIDEASALPQSKAEAIEGNTAGEGFQRILWISNPTRAEGPFFEAFHAKKEFWSTFELDSEDVARWQASRGLKIPGVATLARIEQWAEEYGRQSPFFLVRVKGKFLLHEGGKAISLHMIQVAQQAWDDAEEEGPLWLGLDPAGPGDGGDESAFAIGRGKKCVGLFAFAGLTEDAGIEHLLGFLRTYRRGDEVPHVNVDSEGPIGSKLVYRLRAIAESVKDVTKRFTVAGVRASLPASREPLVYERTRDELVANLARWMNDGGAIPRDHKLEVDLHAADWHGTVSGKLKLTPKDEIRAKIGRSPDRRDALALGVWNPFVAVPVEEPKPEADPWASARGGTYSRGEPFDVQGGNDWWHSR